MAPNPSKDRAMHEGDNHSLWNEFIIFLLFVLTIKSISLHVLWNTLNSKQSFQSRTRQLYLSVVYNIDFPECAFSWIQQNWNENRWWVYSYIVRYISAMKKMKEFKQLNKLVCTCKHKQTAGDLRFHFWILLDGHPIKIYFT
jgi:hypothetical protein